MGHSTSHVLHPHVEILKDGFYKDINLWRNGRGITVTTYGPGDLYLMSVQNDMPEYVLGFTRTSADYTEFLIGFSHYFDRFIFCWKEHKPTTERAVFETFNSPVKYHMGTDWTNAVQVERGSRGGPQTFSRVKVTNEERATKPNNSMTTVYITKMGKPPEKSRNSRATIIVPGYPNYNPHASYHPPTSYPMVVQDGDDGGVDQQPKKEVYPLP